MCPTRQFMVTAVVQAMQFEPEVRAAVHIVVDVTIAVVVDPVPGLVGIRRARRVVVVAVFEPAVAVTILVGVRPQRVCQRVEPFLAVEQPVAVGVVVERVGADQVVLIEVEQQVTVAVHPLEVLVDEVVAVVVEAIEFLIHARITGGVLVITVGEPVPTIPIGVVVEGERVGAMHVHLIPV